MNLQHLRYIIEVEKTESISKAAENLFMAQPNLSKAIKELEESIGIAIFKRTTKGAKLTEKGAEFVTFAKSIINQIDSVERRYQNDAIGKLSLSISVPRASYIANAFTQFVKSLDVKSALSLNYKETNAMRAISNITNGDFCIGIIRYQEKFENYFHMLFEEREFAFDDISKFCYVILMSENHPLAAAAKISVNDLSEYIEITHGDPYVPMLPAQDIKDSERLKEIDKRIYVYERGSQFDLLNEIHTTFMRVSPVPDRLMNRYRLVQKRCAGLDIVYKDVLVYNANHVFTDLEKALLEKIRQAADEMSEKLLSC